MGKRGPKPLFSYQERLDELRKHEIFDGNGDVKKESDPVWQLICNNLNANISDIDKKIKVRNIQQYVYQNRSQILSDLKANSDSCNVIDSCTENSNVIVPNAEEILLSIQNDFFYKTLIKEFTVYPFTTFHWSTEATDFISDYVPKNIFFIFAKIGSFCKNVIAPDGLNSNKIFLYSLGTEINNKFIPICQFSSEDDSRLLIYRFFSECLKSSLRLPKKLLLDYNANHYIAANSVLNVDMTYESYLTTCFSYIKFNKTNTDLPNCVIQSNVRLLIVKVKRWDCVINTSLDSVKGTDTP